LGEHNGWQRDQTRYGKHKRQEFSKMQGAIHAIFS
jgi:hypothetical protein